MGSEGETPGRRPLSMRESTTTGLFDLFLLSEHCSADPRLRLNHSYQRLNDAVSKLYVFMYNIDSVIGRFSDPQ